MPRSTTNDAELLPIDEVARRLGIRASAIRYYEERGLVLPLSRQSGRRWYGPSEIRRLAIILYWQEYALMSLDEIGEVLAGSGATGGGRKSCRAGSVAWESRSSVWRRHAPSLCTLRHTRCCT